MSKSTAYFGNLPYSVTEQDLRDLLGGSREITRVFIPIDKGTTPPRPKGFAFIEFTTAGLAEDAVAAFDGTSFGGRTIKVSIARERQPKTGGKREDGRSRSNGRRDRRDNG